MKLCRCGCGNTFEPRANAHIYASDECKRRVRRDRYRLNHQLPQRHCVECDSEFTPAHAAHICCSQRCLWRRSRRLSGSTAHAKFRRRIKRLYGLTPEHYEQMLESQGGGCAICRGSSGKQRFHIDHDHKTGRVRGLLCGPCNTSLGLLQEDPTRLRAALAYLKENTMSDKTNPNSVWGPNEYPHLDGAGLSGPIGVPLEQGGLSVDRARINKTMGGSGAATKSSPLGTPEAHPGY